MGRVNNGSCQQRADLLKHINELGPVGTLVARLVIWYSFQPISDVNLHAIIS